jgi:acetyl-CoA acetyltransferase
VIVATAERARQLSRDAKIRVELLGFGQARAAQAYMPEAPVPAAKAALARAGVDVKNLRAVKTHNPFAVNDIVLARELDFPLERINNFGCSLVWGHRRSDACVRSLN